MYSYCALRMVAVRLVLVAFAFGIGSQCSADRSAVSTRLAEKRAEPSGGTPLVAEGIVLGFSSPASRAVASARSARACR